MSCGSQAYAFVNANQLQLDKKTMNSKKTCNEDCWPNSLKASPSGCAGIWMPAAANVWGNAALARYGDAVPYLSAAGCLALTLILSLTYSVADPDAFVG